MPAQPWLDVPFADKDAAKAAGARWDPKARRWYASRPGVPELARWLPRPPIPAVLPGEDRQFGGGLFVDLVPSSCWFTNVRSCIDPVDWQRLRRVVFGRAGHVCEACGAGPDRAAGRWLEAHERWAYTEDHDPVGGRGPVQALRRIICLCTWCHQATHYGLAQLRGTDAAAFAHLRTVTRHDRARGPRAHRRRVRPLACPLAAGLDPGPARAHRRRRHVGPATRGHRPCGRRGPQPCARPNDSPVQQRARGTSDRRGHPGFLVVRIGQGWSGRVGRSPASGR